MTKSLKVGVIGSGVVGSAIAYILSQEPEWSVTVVDQRDPFEWQATGAALGVLMATLSSKLKGRHVRLRLESLGLYETWIPELEALTQSTIPYNRNGILHLCFSETELARWQKTIAVRHRQGFQLEALSREVLFQKYPDLISAAALPEQTPVVGAIYAPQDRQVNPVSLTQALIHGAQIHGAAFQFGVAAQGFQTVGDDLQQRITHLKVQDKATGRARELSVDYLVIAAGLGSTSLTQQLQQSVATRPVLGQALRLRCPQPLPSHWPVVNGQDVHLVPLNTHELWVGATVEFPSAAGTDGTVLLPDPSALVQVKQQAIALYPPLVEADVQHTWQGLRPRPEERAAPIIERLPGYANVILATGHYRNGVLLAPITAQHVKDLIGSGDS